MATVQSLPWTDPDQAPESWNGTARINIDLVEACTTLLVVTKVATRGLDAEGIDHVINYDLPDSEQLFTHRVDRTGRMGRAGEAVTFVTSDEEKQWNETELGLGGRPALKPWTVSD